MNFKDILEAKLIYQKGENVTQYFQKKYSNKDKDISSEIIEVAYDLQAGSYIKFVKSNRKKVECYTSEISEILNSHLVKGDSLLDVGTGEITTLTLVLNKIDIKLSNILAFDLSLSRLSKGLKFYNENKNSETFIKIFCADIKEIPLHENCVDVITSSHALEPNGKNLNKILAELFRITKKKLVLFEPSYELNSKEGRARMDKFGYIKNIEGDVVKLGGKILDIIPINNVYNKLNPTACYVIEPPKSKHKRLDLPTFCVPGTNFKLKNLGNFLLSKDTGLAFAVFDDIPILRMKSSILATHKC